jgi:hypothetical protein
MRAHREQKPPDLHERANKIPKRAGAVVMSALSKNPAERPQTAFAFASALRGQSEGVGALYRRAFALYSEYFPKFLKLSLIAHVPMIITSILLISAYPLVQVLAARRTAAQGGGVLNYWDPQFVEVRGDHRRRGVISGVTAIIITQLTAAPLRPVKLREAFIILRKRWRPFLKTLDQGHTVGIAGNDFVDHSGHDPVDAVFALCSGRARGRTARQSRDAPRTRTCGAFVEDGHCSGDTAILNSS